MFKKAECERNVLTIICGFIVRNQYECMLMENEWIKKGKKRVTCI